VARTTIDTWDKKFYEKSRLFDSIHQVSLPFSVSGKWPELHQFSSELHKKNICSHGNKPVHAVAQAEAPELFEDYYESRIYLQGELQTRLENWHDFFNAMCWLQFPRIKSELNALHFEYSQQRQAGTNRTPMENAITLFDECGAVIVADDESLLELIHNHQWKSLFVDAGENFGRHIQCYVSGHAMFEKALTPYVGMTAHTILLIQNSSFFRNDFPHQLAEVDRLISDLWRNREIENPKDLQPFPLLGVPGWWNEEQNEAFYDNKSYFRDRTRGRRVNTEPSTAE
jgi:hypothetical protein